MCLQACAKWVDSASADACAKSHPGICFPLIPSTVSNESDSGQWRLWSDCPDAQADLGLPCLHMLDDVFTQPIWKDVFCFFSALRWIHFSNHKRDNFFDFVFAFIYTKPFLKYMFSFSSRVFFRKEAKNNSDSAASPKSVSNPLNPCPAE